MKSNKYILRLTTLAVVGLGIVIADLRQPDRGFSENENRILASKPKLTMETLFDGSFMKDYETYISDQFVFRDGWITLKTYGEKWLGKKDINGVYLLPDGELIERTKASTMDREKIKRKVKALASEISEIQEKHSGDTYVMLVPTAAEIYGNRLPLFAEEYSQKEFLAQAKEALPSEARWVDAYGSLEAHAEEKLYYGTDHHWTTLGAFYGYESFCQASGREKPKQEEYSREILSEEFLGTLHSKINLAVPYDTIESWTWEAEPSYEINYVYENKTDDSFYETSHLAGKDKYAVFLDSNHPLIEITSEGTGAENRKKSILVVKNSYANCFVPFLLRDYEKIYVLDPRYYRAGTQTFLEGKEIEDVLYLYDVLGFLK